jgi:hypothetical protein
MMLNEGYGKARIGTKLETRSLGQAELTSRSGAREGQLKLGLREQGKAMEAGLKL